MKRIYLMLSVAVFGASFVFAGVSSLENGDVSDIERPEARMARKLHDKTRV